jgi:hypothetical protein
MNWSLLEILITLIISIHPVEPLFGWERILFVFIWLQIIWLGQFYCVPNFSVLLVQFWHITGFAFIFKEKILLTSARTNMYPHPPFPCSFWLKDFSFYRSRSCFVFRKFLLICIQIRFYENGYIKNTCFICDSWSTICPPAQPNQA